MEPTNKTGLTRAEKLTFLILFVGYVCYYLTRKNFPVASVWMKDLGVLTMAQIGYLSSAGTLACAAGKFANGFLADRIGGKRTFLTGMFGSVAATFLFGGSSTYALFLIAWAANGYFLSMGWVGLIRVMSHWFGSGRRGTLVGWMSLNYQMGSAIAKSFAAFLMGFSFLTWRGLFFVPALVLLVMALVTLFTLRERPRLEGVPAPESAWGGPAAWPASGAGVLSGASGRVRGERDAAMGLEGPTGTAAGLRGQTGRLSGEAGSVAALEEARPAKPWYCLLKSPAFLLILWGSAALTLIRTFFDDFTALWLNQSGLPAQAAGYVSSLFTVGGMIGTVAVGYISDRHGKGNRAPYMVMCGLMFGALLFFSAFFPKNSVPLSTLFFTLAGVLFYGIYSVLAGVTAVDFGGEVAPSTAAGIIDSVGYLAAAGAGVVVAHTRNVAQWESLTLVFAGLTVMISLSLVPLWKSYPTRSILAEAESR